MNSTLSLIKNDLHLLSIENLRNWIKNSETKKANEKQKKEWKTNAEKDTFFFNTELLAINEEAIIILINNEEEQNFLFLNYDLEEQKICLQIWKKHKHIIVINKTQYNQLLNKNNKEQNAKQTLILLKDEKSIEESASSFFKKMNLYEEGKEYYY